MHLVSIELNLPHFKLNGHVQKGRIGMNCSLNVRLSNHRMGDARKSRNDDYFAGTISLKKLTKVCDR